MDDQRQQHDASRTSAGLTRRQILKTGALAAGAVAVPSLGGRLTSTARAQSESCALTLTPRYFPIANFTPEIDLKGKLAVISGASRGNGRAVGETLAARGVDVIGTSRNPAGVPNPPTFPLLPSTSLILYRSRSSPASLLCIQPSASTASHPTSHKRHGDTNLATASDRPTH